MNKHNHIFRRSAWIALLAIMLQLFMPVLHPAMAAMPQHNVRICSSAHTTHQDGDKTAPQKPTCPICLSMQILGNGFVPPEATILLSIAFDNAYLVVPTETSRALNRYSSPAQPRAPPTLV